MYVYCAGCGNLIPGLGTPDTFGLGVGPDYRYSHGHGCRSGIAVFIPDNKGGCGEGGWVVFLISGIYLGAVKNLVLLAGGLGICFLLSMVLVFKGIIQGTDRGRLRIPLLPFLLPAGIGVMFL